MYRIALILLAVSLCSGALVPIREAVEDGQRDQTKQMKQQASTTSQIGSQLQTYPAGQSAQLASGQYYYPTYPEYNSVGYSAAQSGYEGYLIPTAISPQRNSNWISDVAMTLLPFSSQVIVYGARAGAYLLHLLFIVIVGGAFTTAICTFTPFCTINFPSLGLTKNQVKEQVAELARTYVTPESLNAATILVTKAIDKYAALQREKDAESKRTADVQNNR